ncbi:MAG: thiamine pyrophosphate-binding protein [Chloroflexi bacterium]|nr:thiamine pyrophosphate-binding protein [Chloroflexota bacterium]
MTTGSAAQYGSDVLVDLLAGLDVPYAAFNPGASFRGLHDSLVNYAGDRKPRTIMCTHEETAVALAHGYTKATGRPMTALIHDVVGLQHASMAIFNAWCDRVPILLLGGSGPQDAALRRPWIEWIHTALVQGNLVRDFVKWDDQPVSLQGAVESILRSWRLMQADPAAPVYIALDATIQEGPVPAGFSLPSDLARWTEQASIQADPAGLDRLAGWLAESQRPVILADRVGRDAGAAATLQELAELLQAPVVDLGARFNFPSTHSLDAAGASGDLLREADVVLALDLTDLYGALRTPDRNRRAQGYAPPSDAKVASISTAELLVRSWTSDYQRIQPVDLNLVGETRLALPALVTLVRERLTAASGRSMAEARAGRATRLAKAAAERRAAWEAQAREGIDRSTISTAFFGLTLREALKGHEWVLGNSDLRGWIRRLWSVERPEQWLGGSGGAGLGYGIGAALGVGLAHLGSEKVVVNIQPDGDLLYATSALWTAASERLPLLTVMWNNRSYYNSEEHAERIARTRGRDVERRGIGTRPEGPFVDFATVARGFDMEAEGPIESPRDLPAALERGIRAVADGRPYLLDVITEAR